MSCPFASVPVQLCAIPSVTVSLPLPEQWKQQRDGDGDGESILHGDGGSISELAQGVS